jgi:hypothetical protein
MMVIRVRSIHVEDVLRRAAEERKLPGLEIIATYKVEGVSRTFVTYKAAIKAYAWRMMQGKYTRTFEDGFQLGISTVAYVRGRICSCKDTLPEVMMSDDYWLNCPLHDRHIGYFARLHRRLVRQLLKQYPMPARAEFPLGLEEPDGYN